MHSNILLALLASSSTTVFARPADQQVSGSEVTGTTCTQPDLKLNTHDTNVALLSICGSIAKPIEFCQGNPKTTTGVSGTSKFTITPEDSGATINVSKGRWERCIKAAMLSCKTGGFESTCIGGATSGNLKFSLGAA